MGMLSASERDHRKPVWEGREVLLQFVRGPARRDEVEFVEIEAPVGGAGDGKMAVVDGIERAAENRNTARMMFCGGAVRLRGGQRGSQVSAAGPDWIKAAHSIDNSLTNLLLCWWRAPRGQHARMQDD